MNGDSFLPVIICRISLVKEIQHGENMLHKAFSPALISRQFRSCQMQNFWQKKIAEVGIAAAHQLEIYKILPIRPSGVIASRSSGLIRPLLQGAGALSDHRY